jgi:hypothetical protein
MTSSAWARQIRTTSKAGAQKEPTNSLPFSVALLQYFSVGWFAERVFVRIFCPGARGGVDSSFLWNFLLVAVVLVRPHALRA